MALYLEPRNSRHKKAGVTRLICPQTLGNEQPAFGIGSYAPLSAGRFFQEELHEPVLVSHHDWSLLFCYNQL